MLMTLVSAGRSDITVRKSRFLGCVQPVADRPAALAANAEAMQQALADLSSGAIGWK